MFRVLASLLLVGAFVTAGAAAQTAPQTTIDVITALPPRDQPRQVILPGVNAKPVVGRSTIRGRVTTTDGQPVRRATVRIAASELKATRTILTDIDGRYEFAELPAGRYSVTASKSAFVIWAYGQTQPNSPARPLSLADNQTADNIDIRLPRGGVITGRVTDDLGEPVVGASVALLRQQFTQGQRRLVPAVGRGTTNDNGEYRIYGLNVGTFFVSATPGPATLLGGGPAEGSEARNGFAATFYPGTTDIAAAQRVVLGLSQTIGEINFSLQATRLATVSGTVVDSQGNLRSNGGISLMRRGDTIGVGGNGSSIRNDGTFSINNVAPGEYVIRATTLRQPPAPGSTPPRPELSIAVVTVNGEDVTGVRLAPIVTVSLSGRVIFDDAAAAQSVKASSVRIAAQSVGPDDFGPIGIPQGPPSTVHDDWTFDIEVAPGRFALRPLIAGAGAPAVAAPRPLPVPTTTTAAPTWMLKAVRVNGLDVTDTGVEVGSQGSRNVEIELTNRRAEVTGAVTDNRGAAVKDYVVVVFAQDRAKWTAPLNRYIVSARPGDDNRFKVTTLPAGQYFAIALDHADASQWQDPDVLQSLSQQATAISLGDSGDSTVDLKLFALQ